LTSWDIVITIINQFPPVAAAMLLIIAIVAVVIGIAGFSKYGMDFIRHGFRQNPFGDMLGQLATKADIEGLRNEVSEVRADVNKLETELATIKVNHFGHLKNFLTELTGILVDKKILNVENKARLDNHLRGM